jgi:hypothetical protein
MEVEIVVAQAIEVGSLLRGREVARVLEGLLDLPEPLRGHIPVSASRGEKSHKNYWRAASRVYGTAARADI